MKGEIRTHIRLGSQPSGSTNSPTNTIYFLNIFLSTKKNKQPPTKFAIIVEYVVSIFFNDIKQNANTGVDNCHLSKYNKYSFI